MRVAAELRIRDRSQEIERLFQLNAPRGGVDPMLPRQPNDTGHVRNILRFGGYPALPT